MRYFFPTFPLSQMLFNRGHFKTTKFNSFSVIFGAIRHALLILEWRDQVFLHSEFSVQYFIISIHNDFPFIAALCASEGFIYSEVLGLGYKIIGKYNFQVRAAEDLCMAMEATLAYPITQDLLDFYNGFPSA